MPHLLPLFLRALAAFVLAWPLLAAGQTLNISNDVQKFATLINTTATLTGTAELHLSGTGDPMTGSTIHLNSPDAWFFLPNILPSQVVSTLLGRVRVSGAAAVVDSNVRVVQYGTGAVVIPHAPSFPPMEVFDGKAFTGSSKLLRQYVTYDDSSLGLLKTAISSFRLKRGYMATIAQNENGTGISRCYVAQDGDLEVSVLPGALDNQVRFVRIFPWRWVSKKGIGGNITSGLNLGWYYNWNLDQNSSRDLEYVPIRQTRWWPGLGQNWQTRGANHLLGYNEPDRPDQANMTVGDAIWSWPDLLGTGLRLGAPAVSDGGLNWLYSFMDEADAAGLRVDYVPVHYYRCYGNANDPVGAANQHYNFLKGIYDRVKRPLWVTEWNNGANWTTCADPTFAQQQAAVAEIIKMLDNTHFVERYAIFNWVEDVRRVKWDDGSLTAAGVTYRDKVSPNSYIQELPDSEISPAAHYTFNGDLRDSLVNGNDGMAVGAPTFATGKHGKAVVLDGSTDYVQVSPALGDSTDFSFAGWVKWNGGGNWQRIFDFGDGTSRFLFLSPRTSSGNLRFTINTGSGEQVINAPALATGVWTHVAVTLSGNTGKLFVNGALAASNTSMTGNPIDVGTRLNYIGKSQFTADPLFNGQLDDLRFFASALSDAQIASMAGSTPPQFTVSPIVAANGTPTERYAGSVATLVTGGVGARTFAKVSGPAWLSVAANGTLSGFPTAADRGVNRFLVRVSDANGALDTATLEINVAAAPRLIARYAFDGTTAATVGGADGAPAGSPGYAAGRVGTAIDLDGTDDFVTFPAGIANEAEITLAAWVWWDGSSNWQRIFDFGNGTGEYMYLSPKSGSNTLRFAIKNNGAEQTLNSTPLTIGQWVHVAVSLGANVGRLYVNGSVVDTQPITIKPTDIGAAANYLGKSQFADPLFNGRIDEFLIFDHVLSTTQLAAIVGKRAPVFTADPINKPAGVAGQPYEETIAGSATDADAGGTLTYTKIAGPEWLTISANGRISGVPPTGDNGINQFIVRVTDETSLADEAVLRVTVPGSSLIARYQFNGSTADDMGGGAGVLTGSPAYEAGQLDKAIDLDGSDDYVRLPAGLVNTLADMTIAARVRWDGGGAWQRIFDFGNSTSQYMVLTPSSGNGKVQFAITTNGSSTVQSLEGPAPLPIGQWSHVAVTLIGNTGTVYVNGTPVISGSITLDPSAVASSLNYLGKSQFAADPLLNGAIDDFQIYGRGLSAAEISALAVPPVPVSVPDSSYSGWSAGIALPPGQDGPGGDPDADGATNGWEYLLGSNPFAAESGLLPDPRVRTAAELGLPGDKSYLTLQVRVRRQRLGTRLVPEGAASVEGLAAPEAANRAHQAGAPIPDGEYEIVTYYYDVPIEDSVGGRGAMRVRMVVE